MRTLPCILLLILFIAPATVVGQEVIPLWPDKPGLTDKDIPTLTLYPPEESKTTGTAIIICPGGSYRGLAGHEGEDYALFLSSLGIRAFVLKYRLGPVYTYKEITADAARAIRLVRNSARAWGIDPNKIGIMGSSAGGHLASTAMTHFDKGTSASPDPIERASSRPDFGILCYPVISMGPIGHAISREQFMGANPPEEIVKLYSNELQVSRETPPAFLWHTFEDTIVGIENSLEFAKALKKNGVPFDLHVTERGRHGLGLGDTLPFGNTLPWTKNLIVWLRGRGLIQ